MEQITFKQIRQDYFEKNCKSLSDMANYITPVYRLNSALLDKNYWKIKSLRKQFELTDDSNEIINVSDNIKNKSRLRIVYLLDSTELNNNNRIIFEQANGLSERGHEVLLYSHSPKPSWIQCKSNFFLVHHDFNLSSVIPSCDIVIAGYWDLVLEALKVNAPLRYYYAQGDNDLLEYDICSPGLKTAIQTAYSIPLRLITVSDSMKQTIQHKFGRKAIKVPNALSPGFFTSPDDLIRENDTLKILIVVMDNLKFYCFDIILEVLQYLKNLGFSFSVNLLTQQRIKMDYSLYNYEINEYYKQTEEEISDLYKTSDIYVCNSCNDSFCMSVLEAMASGAAVVTSDNGGIGEFAVGGYNCLIHEPGNVIKFTYNLQTILNDYDLRQKLKLNGLNTSKKFSWKRSMDKLEKEFKSAATCTFQAIIH
jgi:Glycosyltransferase